ncbi:ABC transporter ATP-binding protein [Leifsonia xyli subsp. cynodontis DSM 46306]|uniref:Uncharacterized protein n=1 Tax=Leifsonia xyli subsp. cynodontis DSM 46306 TaxID=1389489 RepID=U3PAA7_LEIXC|nr:hypothetical protein [Leifsonia xyli]AGW42449.1 ABC transporter ATP-binding protein [Leifsonia xyli subsp. cynodontis DSM 46306]
MTALRTPTQAIAYALAQQRWPHGMCLGFVWSSYAPDTTITSDLTAYGYPPPITRAIDGWNGSPLKHPGDRNPDIGAPVYYTAARSGATAGDGHVALYIGDGMIRTTDAGGYGINATVPLDWPEHNWGRRYLGWTADILGWPIITPTPPIPGEENMPSAVIIKNNDTIDKSLYLVPDDGDLIVLTSMDEVNALIMSGAVRPGPNGQPFITAPDGLLIQMRQQIAARKREQRENGQQNA